MSEHGHALELSLTLPVGARMVPIALETDARSVAIVGASGIGKTTLCRAILGFLPAARGRVVIDGETLADPSARIDRPPHARRLGWVPQDARLWPHLSVRENVRFGAPDRREPPRELLEALGVAALLERRPASLSGGEAQRVAIARALASEPRALVLDEPVSALDRAARAAIADVVREECERRRILRLVVAHDEADLSALAKERWALGETGLSRLP